MFLLSALMTALAAPVAVTGSISHHDHDRHDIHKHEPKHHTHHHHDYQNIQDQQGHLAERAVPKSIRRVGKVISKGWSKIKNLVKSKEKPPKAWTPPKNSLEGFRYSMAETIRDRQRKGRPSTSGR
jgi:hypothetical protein